MVKRSGEMTSTDGSALMSATPLVHAFGGFDAEWSTQIWTIQAGGVQVELWQEYALLFAFPASALAFVLGSVVGRRRA